MNYTIELAQQELQLVGSALAALPYGQVAPLMMKLQQQASAQEAAEAAKSLIVAAKPAQEGTQGEQGDDEAKA